MLDKYYESALKDAYDSLKNDGVIIIPTDTLYGLAALASSKVGTERIFEIKNRSKEKILPIIVNSYKMLTSVIEIDLDKLKKLSKYFPGPITIVAKRNKNFDYYNVDTIAVRMIETPLVNKIIEMVNEPLVLTSANISNNANTLDPMELLEMFDGCVDCVFLAGKIKDEASTIIKLNDDDTLTLIREGKIPFNKILEEYNQ